MGYYTRPFKQIIERCKMPNATEKKLRADLERIKKMIEEHEVQKGPDGHNLYDEGLAENSILRELLTSWTAVTSNEYNTDERLTLMILTKKMLDPASDE